MIPWSDDPASIRPMLATTADAPLDSTGLAYEPKYDGIRAIASVPGGQQPVRVWSRLGNEKTAQFPEIVSALQAASRRFGRPVVIDGEIVALDGSGDPIGFQGLQGRIHLKSGTTSDNAAGVAFIVFDLLRDGDEDLRPLPLRDRRVRLERLMAPICDPESESDIRHGEPHSGPDRTRRGKKMLSTSEGLRADISTGRPLAGSAAPRPLRISEQAVGDGRSLFERAERLGWEGLIAKSLSSVYKSGRRTPEWRKLKLVRRQACVVGGWTDPRGSRPFFGALLLGLYDDAGRLEYVGHTGAGFSDAELGRVWKRLQALKTKTCPFVIMPRTNERPQWVRPVLVAEVKFTEWTADNKLRHPTYLGLREDMKAEQARKEPDRLAAPRREMARSPRSAVLGLPGRSSPKAAVGRRTSSPSVAASAFSTAVASAKAARRTSGRTGRSPRTSASGTRETPIAAERGSTALPSPALVTRLLEQLDAIQESGGNGVLQFPGGARLEVTNLGKIFWPKLKLTKGDLFRHYTRVARYILPALADRPLVMKRYPNGVAAKPFYQHRAPDKLPPDVRVAVVSTDNERRAHIVGGDLITLLYTAQLASISQDPWFSRVGSEEIVDHVAIDLDPPDGAPFAKVLDVARWVRDELHAVEAPAFAKTSGSSGLHVYVPMPPGTPYGAGLLFCQIVATMVANKHPKAATVERSVAARGGRVYVDYLQNIQGKTLASAYSPRANDFAGVSTPLSWKEVDDGVSPKDFTIPTFERRLQGAGDLWTGMRKSKGADLEAIARVLGTARIEKPGAAASTRGAAGKSLRRRW